jgi:RNA-directed DNA polymerase
MNKGICAIRYADDLIIVAPSREAIIDYVIPRLRAFLKGIGLSLNGAKTRIVHRDEGFNFLSFHFQQFQNAGIPFLMVTPSKEKVMAFLANVKEVIRLKRTAKQTDLIKELNPKIRGWANYFKFCNAYRTFDYVDSRIWRMLWNWARRRHPTKTTRWIKMKYFPHTKRKAWTFKDKEGNVIAYARNTSILAKDYIYLRREASPLDATLRDYWNLRYGKGNTAV